MDWKPVEQMGPGGCDQTYKEKVISAACQGSVLSPVLFNTVINDLDKFADDTKLGIAADIPEADVTLRPGREELHGVQQGDMQVLHVGRNNPVQQ